MTRQEIASLVFKVTGIYVLVQALNLLYSLGLCLDMLAYYAAAGTPLADMGVKQPRLILTFTFVALAFVLLTIAGCLLIARSRKFAVRMFPETEQGSAETRVLGIHALAYSIVGIFVIASTLPDLVSFAARLLTDSWRSWATLWNSQGAFALGLCLKLILGLGLFFGCHGLVRLWSRLRYSSIRREMGLCTRCGYDLTGNTSGVCPECGQKVEHP